MIQTNFRYIAIISMICLVMISCEEQPVYENEGWTEEQFQPEIIEMSKAVLDNHSIILPKNKLISIYGEPKEIQEVCSLSPIQFGQGEKTYDCWRFPDLNMTFGIDEDQAFLMFFSFEENNRSLETPQLTLSKNTSFKKMKNLFPNAYQHRNMGADILGLEGHDWIYLLDDLPNDKKPISNQVKLIFKDDYLKRLEYSWYPTYTEEQWGNYTKKLEQIANRNN